MFAYLSTTEDVLLFALAVLAGFCALEGALSIVAAVKEKLLR